MERIRQEEEDRLVNSAEQYDVTLPMDTDCGSYHPITLVQRELEEIFASMGFTIEDYREVVTDYNCFEALNIPKHHPARDMQDTYYLDNGQLLKTHTSAAQNTIMKSTVHRCVPSSRVAASATKAQTLPTRTRFSRWKAS